jgi:hypothetical protein
MNVTKFELTDQEKAIQAQVPPPAPTREFPNPIQQVSESRHQPATSPFPAGESKGLLQGLVMSGVLAYAPPPPAQVYPPRQVVSQNQAQENRLAVLSEKPDEAILKLPKLNDLNYLAALENWLVTLQVDIIGPTIWILAPDAESRDYSSEVALKKRKIRGRWHLVLVQVPFLVSNAKALELVAQIKSAVHVDDPIELPRLEPRTPSDRAQAEYRAKPPIVGDPFFLSHK